MLVGLTLCMQATCGRITDQKETVPPAWRPGFWDRARAILQLPYGPLSLFRLYLPVLVSRLDGGIRWRGSGNRAWLDFSYLVSFHCA